MSYLASVSSFVKWALFMPYFFPQLLCGSNEPWCKGSVNTEHCPIKVIAIIIIGWAALSVLAAWGDAQSVILRELVTIDLSTCFSKAQPPSLLPPSFPSEEFGGGILFSSPELNPNPRRRRCAKTLTCFANAFAQVPWPAPKPGNPSLPAQTATCCGSTGSVLSCPLCRPVPQHQYPHD